MVVATIEVRSDSHSASSADWLVNSVGISDQVIPVSSATNGRTKKTAASSAIAMVAPGMPAVKIECRVTFDEEFVVVVINPLGVS